MGLFAPIGTKGLAEPARTVLERYEDARARRYPFERAWYLGCSFVLGQQHVQFERGTTRLVDPPRKRSEVRATYNLCTPMVLDRQAKLLRAESVPTGVPARETEAAKTKAHLASSWFSFIRRRTKWKRIKRTLLTWLLATGNAFAWCGWDGEAGRRARRQVGDRTEEVAEGEVFIDPDGPFGSYFDPQAVSLDGARWGLRVRRFDVEVLKDTFGAKAARVVADDLASDFGQYFLESLKNQTGLDVMSVTTSSRGACATTFEYYERSSKRYPRGRMVVLAGSNVVLAEGENPYHHVRGELPVVHYLEHEAPGRFWAYSTLERGIPVQRKINKTYAQLEANKDAIAFPKILKPRGCAVAGSAFTNGVGEKIDFTPVGGMKPEYMAAPSMPADVRYILEGQIQRFREITGWTEITQGTAPSGVSSGVAFQVLAEQNAGPLITVADGIKDSDSEVHRMALTIALERYRERRRIKVFADDERSIAEVSLDPRELRAEDLGEDFDVAMTAGMEVTETRAGREDRIINMVKLKILNPERDRELILHELDMGATDDVFAHSRLDRAKAERENKLMRAGQFPQVDTFDNHPVHIDVHNRERKTPEWESLPDATKLIWEAHVATHFRLAGMPVPGAPPPAAAGNGAPEGAGPAVPAALAGPPAAPPTEGPMAVPGAAPEPALAGAVPVDQAG